MPSGVFGVMTDAGPGAVSTEDLFGGKKVVLFSVPGAFTPTCSMNHVITAQQILRGRLPVHILHFCNG